MSLVESGERKILNHRKYENPPLTTPRLSHFPRFFSTMFPTEEGNRVQMSPLLWAKPDNIQPLQKYTQFYET